MRILAATFCVAAAVLVTPTLAQQSKPPTPAQAAQQQRMTSCNAEASQREFKGDARQTYMSACLGGKMSQTTLMKVCNAQASQDKLTSDTRKTYLSTCLKKST
jgi:psiF repeat-containing protein